ncbi:MAG: sugar phosphate isomerase/epimerase family protein [Armatimonadota bacterium]
MSTYAISTWIFAHLPADEAIRLMAETGFVEAELSATGSALLLAWESDPEGVCAQLAEAGISAVSVHSTHAARVISTPDDDARQAAIDEHIRYFRLMEACGLLEIVVHAVSGVQASDETDWQAAQRRSEESLRVLADEAGEAGLRLAVENSGREGRPGSTMASILEMIDGLGEHVGLCMDIGHSQQARLDLLEELSVALSSGRLFALHLHDVDADGKDHYIPGEGCLDFEPYLAMLCESGYDGGRTLEIRPADPKDVDERIRQVAALRDRWQGL